MEDLYAVVDYIKDEGLTFDLSKLNSTDKIDFYVMQNRMTRVIDNTIKSYRNLKDLMRAATECITEVRTDFERIVSLRYNKIEMVDGVLLLNAIEELAQTDLEEHQNCISYLVDVACAAMYSLYHYQQKSDEEMLALEAMMYVAILGINLFYKAVGKDELLEGVVVVLGE